MLSVWNMQCWPQEIGFESHIIQTCLKSDLLTNISFIFFSPIFQVNLVLQIILNNYDISV